MAALLHPPRRTLKHTHTPLDNTSAAHSTRLLHPPHENEDLGKKKKKKTSHPGGIPLHPGTAPQLKSALTVSPHQTLRRDGGVCAGGPAQAVRMWQSRRDGTDSACQTGAEGGRARSPLHALSVMRSRKGKQTD